MSSPDRWIHRVRGDTNTSSSGGHGGGGASSPAVQGISVGGGVALVICAFMVLGFGLLYVWWVFQWLNDLFSRSGPPEPPHLESKSIALLPTFTYRGGGGAAAAAEEDCSICLGAMSDGEMMRKLPGCGHVFHLDCIDVWLGSRATCPICRDDLLKEEASAETAAGSMPPPLPMLGPLPI